MTVYVIYDELKEDIVCVHALPNIECDICKPIRERDKKSSGRSYIKEFERLVQEPEVKVYDSPAILGYYDDETIPEIDLKLETKIVNVEQRKLECIADADEEDQQPEMQFFNRNTGKMQKLFTELNKVYTVRYVNHEVGDKGEALYITVEAETPRLAVDKAMQTQMFVAYIQMKYFNEKCLHAYQPKGSYVIGKVEYFEGDPRL